MEEEITFEEVFRILRQKNKIIILWALFGLLVSGVYTFFIVTPMFESSSRIVVNQTQNTNQTITNIDIQTNLNLINTYQSIIREPIILEDVLEKTNSSLTIDGLRDKINVQIQDSSLVFGIKVQDENPYIAAELANATATTFEKKIGGILEVESVTILSEAVPNLTAVSPNTTMNLSLGLIIGLMIGVGLAFLSEFMDKRVKDIKFIEDLSWTNLGSVLEMSSSELKETRIDKQMRINNTGSSLSRRRV